LQVEQIVRIKLEALRWTRPYKVYPHGTRSKKNRPLSSGKSRGGWKTNVHMVASDARTAIAFALWPGNAHDAPEGLDVLWELPRMPESLSMPIDRAYQGNETGQLVLDLGMIPALSPSPTA
jgi:hypothetical protein